MCGIFGMVGEWTAIDACTMLQRAAERGPHGWGIMSNAGRQIGIGKFTRPALPSFLGEGPIIGHARLATSGRATALDELQPLMFSDPDGAVFAVAHNGTVPDAPDWQMTCVTNNDSEVLGRWLETQSGAWPVKLCDLSRRLHTNYAIAIWTPQLVWVMRRGHPLYHAGSMACSRPFHDARLIPEDVPYSLCPVPVFVGLER